MIERSLPVILGFLLTAVAVNLFAMDPCKCDGLYPHLRVTTHGMSSQPCIQDCQVATEIQVQRCRSEAWCRQCNGSELPL